VDWRVHVTSRLRATSTVMDTLYKIDIFFRTSAGLDVEYMKETRQASCALICIPQENDVLGAKSVVLDGVNIAEKEDTKQVRTNPLLLCSLQQYTRKRKILKANVDF
jgi:deoxyinosine 3'endonuclease (endonuclease V)